MDNQISSLSNSDIFNNFSQLTEKDFFDVINKISIPSYYIKQNLELSKSSKVLNYMLDLDNYAFRNFKPAAFSSECLNKIASFNIQFTVDDVKNYPILLNNQQLCLKILKQIPTWSEELIKTIVTNGFIPKKEYFYLNEDWKNSSLLITQTFLHDASVIVLFNDNLLNETTTKSAYQRGYIATEEDLINNPSLTHYYYIMEPAIKNNPKLIIYLAEDCAISINLIKDTLDKYKITKEDLINHPQLTKKYSIMYELPELRRYSAFLSDMEKAQIFYQALKKDKINTDTLPFLDYKFGSKVDINKLNQLIKYLKISFNEEDITFQQNYFRTLDKVIDGIINIRYTQNKFSFKYQDIVSLNDAISDTFKNASINQNYDLIIDLINDLYEFCGKTLNINDIKNSILKFYVVFSEKQVLDLELTNEFNNKILNFHRNHYLSTEKEKVLKNIKQSLNLTKKKSEHILVGRKLKKVENIIKEKKLFQLGITEADLKNYINETMKKILANKDIKKLAININNLQNVAQYFYNNGTLTNEIVKNYLNLDKIKTLKYIVNQFTKIKFNLTDKVYLSSNESFISRWDKEKLDGLNYNNFIIADNERYYKNLANLLIQLDDKSLEEILINGSSISEVADLIPLIGLTEEFDIDTYKNILINYQRIKQKLLKNNDSSQQNYKKIILKKFYDLICLANAYNSIDDITLYALGRNIVSQVGEQNSLKYLEFYIEMLKRQRGYIPPIKISNSEYSLESGLYSDPLRLLIGKKPDNKSCIDLLNTAGVATYKEVLLERTGDVILIRNNLNQLVSRILLFRRGNVIQMVTRKYEKFSIELYKLLADQIMQKSLAVNDNIDYIFVNESSIDNVDDKYKVISDNRFVNNFAHADFSSSAVLLTAKDKIDDYVDFNSKMNFLALPQATYQKPRQALFFNPSETDITRLKALDIVLENDILKKEQKIKDFQVFNINNYKKVVCGEDWYLAIKNDNTLEQLILPTNDLRTYEEIKALKEELKLANLGKKI